VIFLGSSAVMTNSESAGDFLGFFMAIPGNVGVVSLLLNDIAKDRR